MKPRCFTKTAMRLASVRMSTREIELLRAAAIQEDKSQSQFIREAVRERARKVLLADEDISGQG